MKIEDHTQYWLDSAAHDWDTAENLFSAGKYDWCLEVRYPQYKNEFHKKCTQPFTERYFKQIESTATWLKSQIKSLP